MTEQISLRLPPQRLKDARQKAKKGSFGTVQAYIEQTIREDIYDDYELTKKERLLIDTLLKNKGNPKYWSTEAEYDRVIRNARKNSGR